MTDGKTRRTLPFYLTRMTERAERLDFVQSSTLSVSVQRTPLGRKEMAREVLRLCTPEGLEYLAVGRFPRGTRLE